MSEQPVEKQTGTDPSETVDTNAGRDAIQGTVAEQPPTDKGDQKDMNDFSSDSGTQGGGNQPEQPSEE